MGYRQTRPPAGPGLPPHPLNEMPQTFRPGDSYDARGGLVTYIAGPPQPLGRRAGGAAAPVGGAARPVSRGHARAPARTVATTPVGWPALPPRAATTNPAVTTGRPETRPTAGKAWAASGEAHDRRCFKQRAQGEVRIVPIPHPLVRLLREHLKEFGTAKDGRLFSSERGNVIAASSYSRAWKQARELALVPDQVSSVLAFRPYDLRHAGVSQWLNSGVPAPEVAARAGHSVDVLLKIYAKCIDGQEQEMNDRIMQGLGEGDDLTD